MSLLPALLLFSHPASADGYLRTLTAMVSTEHLCGFQYPDRVKAHFMDQAGSELGVEDATLAVLLRERTAGTIAEVRGRGAVAKYCEDMKVLERVAKVLD